MKLTAGASNGANGGCLASAWHCTQLNDSFGVRPASLLPIACFSGSGLIDGSTAGDFGGQPFSAANPAASPAARGGNAGMRACRYGRGLYLISPAMNALAHSGLSFSPNQVISG